MSRCPSSTDRFSQYSLRDGSMPGRARVPLNVWINRTGRRLAGHTWRKELRFVRPEPTEPREALHKSAEALSHHGGYAPFDDARPDRAAAS